MLSAAAVLAIPWFTDLQVLSTESRLIQSETKSLLRNNIVAREKIIPFVFHEYK